MAPLRNRRIRSTPSFAQIPADASMNVEQAPTHSQAYHPQNAEFMQTSAPWLQSRASLRHHDAAEMLVDPGVDIASRYDLDHSLSNVHLLPSAHLPYRDPVGHDRTPATPIPVAIDPFTPHLFSLAHLSSVSPEAINAFHPGSYHQSGWIPQSAIPDGSVSPPIPGMEPSSHPHPHPHLPYQSDFVHEHRQHPGATSRLPHRPVHAAPYSIPVYADATWDINSGADVHQRSKSRIKKPVATVSPLPPSGSAVTQHPPTVGSSSTTLPSYHSTDRMDPTHLPVINEDVDHIVEHPAPSLQSRKPLDDAKRIAGRAFEKKHRLKMRNSVHELYGMFNLQERIAPSMSAHNWRDHSENSARLKGGNQRISSDLQVHIKTTFAHVLAHRYLSEEDSKLMGRLRDVFCKAVALVDAPYAEADPSQSRPVEKSTRTRNKAAEEAYQAHLTAQEEPYLAVLRGLDTLLRPDQDGSTVVLVTRVQYLWDRLYSAPQDAYLRMSLNRTVSDFERTSPAAWAQFHNPGQLTASLHPV